MKLDSISSIYRFERTVAEAASQVGVTADSPLLVAVSGGADSMALLNAAVRCGIPVIAAHCNFNLRGEESIRDAEFVKAECNRLEVALYYKEFDTRAYMTDHRLSLELACRKLRYQWFDDIMASAGAVRIAVAHHRDDNAETMLLNLLRGAGVDGLKGMVQDTGRILRPLLQFSRHDVREYLVKIGCNHIEDSSNNDDSDSDRNYLRLQVLPMLRKRWPGVDKSLETSRRNVQRASTVMTHYIAECLAREAEQHAISRSAVTACADPPSLIHAFMNEEGPCRSQAQEEEIAAAMLAGPGKGQRWFLHNDRLATYRGTMLKITDAAHSVRNKFNQYPVSPCEINNIINELKLLRNNNKTLLPHSLEYYKFRPPCPGERFDSMGMKGSKLIFDILAEAGVPSHIRSSYEILVDPTTDIAVWIPGVRRSRHHRVSGNQEDVWIVEISGD